MIELGGDCFGALRTWVRVPLLLLHCRQALALLKSRLADQFSVPFPC
jgi:hypothetical protein